MTDNDIIKAFELCFAKTGTNFTCYRCPYHKYGNLCKVERNRDALDLINRLKAENERLQKLVDEYEEWQAAEAANDYA